MDVPAVVDGLRQALVLQHRSALQYAIASGSLFGLELQSLGDTFWEWARDELADVRLLVEKVTALDGEPTVEVGEVGWSAEPQQMVQLLIDTETETIEALGAVIEKTGKEGRSEALEHLLEHMIMRKQTQVDFLLRARRSP